MTRHYSSTRSVASPSSQIGDSGRHTPDSGNLDAFVSNVYLPHVKLRKRSWSVDERIARQHLSPTFGARELADIQRYEVEDWLHGLSSSGLAPATCNRILAVFKTICSLAVMRGLLPAGQSPCAGVSPFKIHTQRERYLTQDEAQRLMRALEKSDRPEAFAIRLLLLTGARKNEILKARWENIRLDQRLLTVPVSKSGKPRHISLSDEAVEVICSILRVPGCPWLFPGRAPGKSLSDIYMFWNRLRRGLGLADVRIHDLRHTFASFLVNAGHSLYEVQKLLGHGDPRTTMRYAHLGQASLLAAAETVSGFFIPRKSRDRIKDVFSPPAGRKSLWEAAHANSTRNGHKETGRRTRKKIANHKRKRRYEDFSKRLWTPSDLPGCPRACADYSSIDSLSMNYLKPIH